MGTSIVERDALVGNLLDRLDALERRLRYMEDTHPGVGGEAAGKLAYYREDGSLHTPNGILTVTADGTVLIEGMGELLFSYADGRLLLGPGCAIASTSWTSLRGQVATIAGALHTVAGKWVNQTQALMVEEAASNLVANPSFEVDIAGWATAGSNTIARSTTRGKFGTGCLLCTYQDNAALAYYGITVPGATIYFASTWIWIPDDYDGDGVRIILANFAGSTGTVSAYADMTRRNVWQRVVVGPVTIVAGDLVGDVLIYTDVAPTAGRFVYVDGVQCIGYSYQNTSYLDGSLGTGYAWTGAAHASVSTRARTDLSIPTIGILNCPGPYTMFARVWCPFAYNDGQKHIFIDTGAAWNQNRVTLYQTDSGELSIAVRSSVAGGDRRLVYTLTSAFGSGRWHEIAATADATGTPTGLYLDGLLVDGTYAETATWAAPTVWGTDLRFGRDIADAWSLNGAFAEIAIFGRELTAAEVAWLHQLDRAVMDAGAAAF